MTLFVVGNVTEDIVFVLPHLPAHGETLIAESRLSDIGGKGLNQALIAGRCGMKVRLIAPIGRDEAGRRARKIVAAEPLDAAFVEKEGPTDQSIISVARNGDNHIISTAFAASALTEDDVMSAAPDAGPGLASRGAGEIIVTLGADGAVCSSGRHRHVVAAAPARVVDTAGAGDTFCGVFIAARDRGYDWPAAMETAARAAAITIARSGTFSAFPSTQELAALFVPFEREATT